MVPVQTYVTELLCDTARFVYWFSCSNGMHQYPRGGPQCNNRLFSMLKKHLMVMNKAYITERIVASPDVDFAPIEPVRWPKVCIAPRS